MNFLKIIPNPVQGHRKHHQPSVVCYRKLDELRKTHYLATWAKGREKENFLRELADLGKKLKEANHQIAISRHNIREQKQKWKKTRLYSLRESLARKIKMHQKELKKLKGNKRFLKGDIYTLTRPENRFLFSMEQIYGTLEANKQKTIRKDKTIPRVCAYLGGFLGAIPATLLAVMSIAGAAIPAMALVGSTFLGSGGGGVLGLMLEKPFRKLRKKLF